MRNKKVFMISTDYYGVERSIKRAFVRNGYETVFVNSRMNSMERLISKLARDFSGVKKALNPFLKAILLGENKKYIAIAEGLAPGFVFIVKGDSVFPGTLRHLKEKLGISCLSYQWDDPFPSYQGTAGGNDYRDANFVQGMKHYDHIFVFDDYYTSELRKRSVDNVSYLPLAADDELFRKVELTSEERERFGYDVCFIGMPYENRIETLNGLGEYNVGVFGDHWEKYSGRMMGNYFRGKASGEMVQKIYSASKIILNINHPQSKEGVNARTFEIPCGESFEIVNYVKGLEDLFVIGEEIVSYNNNKELHGMIGYYLAHDEERREIVKRGRERVIKEHTWVERVKAVIAMAN